MAQTVYQTAERQPSIDEIEDALVCAKKIRDHMLRAIARNEVRFLNNLEALDAQIEEYQNQLVQTAVAV